MGINGLWEHVKGAVTKESLTAIALNEIVSTDGVYRPFRIGIDISIWFAQSQQKFLLAHAQRGENPELNLMFNRITRLFRSPVLPIFVFDGPARPAMKRRRMILTKDHWLAASAREMIRAFGFTYHDAPGEAEAELASMNTSGLIDAVLTDDSDTLVFGALRIIRNPTVKLYGDDVDVYSNNTRACKEELEGLTREGFVLVATLAGGDYDPTGLRSCGVETASRLARYGLGESLVAAAMIPQPQSAAALAEWRATLRYVLREDPEGHIGHRCKSAAMNIDDDFPKVNVVRAYCTPLVTDPAELRKTIEMQWVMPDISKLSQFCELHFGWGLETKLTTKFLNLIWPGVVLRCCCKVRSCANSTAMPLIDRKEPIDIVGKLHRDSIMLYRINTSTAVFLDAVKAKLHNSRADSRIYQAKRRKLEADAVEIHGYPVDIPVSLLVELNPQLLAQSSSVVIPSLDADSAPTSNVRYKGTRRIRKIMPPPAPVRVALRHTASTAQRQPVHTTSPTVYNRSQATATSKLAVAGPSKFTGYGPHMATIEVIDLTADDDSDPEDSGPSQPCKR